THEVERRFNLFYVSTKGILCITELHRMATGQIIKCFRIRKEDFGITDDGVSFIQMSVTGTIERIHIMLEFLDHVSGKRIIRRSSRNTTPSIQILVVVFSRMIIR